MKKILFLVLFLGGLIGAVLVNQANSNAVDSIQDEVAFAQIEAQAESEILLPKKPKSLVIPSLEVSVDVEHVGKDSEGRMDIPQDPLNTAWYELGALPGEKGNAVIAGHYDTPTGDPSIFYDLASLQEGDEIVSVDEEGNEYVFKVTDIVTYDNDEFPLREVFGSHDKARLNLITCAGEFDRELKDYSERTVVYSELFEIRQI